MAVPNKERSRQTREKLIQTGRALFTSKGFSKVSAQDLVREAGLTRGALYHHFNGKAGLFAAVYESMQQELSLSVEKMVEDEPGPWAELVAGIRVYLAACEDPDIQQVFFVDGPAVLGWDTCRETDARYAVALLKRGIEDAIRSQEAKNLPVEPLIHLLSGAMREAGMWISNSPDPKKAREDASRVVEELLQGIKI